MKLCCNVYLTTTGRSIPPRRNRENVKVKGKEEKKCGHIPVRNCLNNKLDNTAEMFIKTMIVYKFHVHYSCDHTN